MKYVIILLSMLVAAGCSQGGNTKAAGGGAAVSATTASETGYRYKFEGNGVTFSTSINGYAGLNGTGLQTNDNHAGVTLGATPIEYTMQGRSMQASITLNTGAGVLLITTYKNGVAIRSDSISTNATNISISHTE